MINNVIDIIIEYYPLLLKGLGITALLSLVTVLFGAVIGMIIALMRLSNNKLLKGIASFYVEVIRGVPLLLQLLIIYIALPSSVSKFVAAAIALIINSGAYVAEIIRGGIQAVDNGQMDAARSLGLSKKQAMIKIILPQAVKNILPAIGNEYVTVIKETSLASTFYIGDLMTSQKYIGTETYLYLESYIVVAIFYFAATFTLSKLIGVLERRLKVSD